MKFLKKTWILSLLSLSLGSHAKNSQDANWQVFMDPQTWKTYCTGRYLIDLPSGLNPEWAGGNGIYGEDIIWQKDMTSHEQVQARIEYMKNNLKNLLEIDYDPAKSSLHKDGAPSLGDQLFPREDGKPYFVKQIDYANGGIGILAHDTSSGKGMQLYNYFITENPFQVFYREVDFVFENNMDEIIAREQKLAQALRSRGDHEIPTGPGICIYKAFITGEHTDMKESTGIKLNYPYYSRDYYFQIGIGNLVMREPQHVHPKKQNSKYPRIIKTYLDSSSKRVAGLQGMEYAMQRKNEWHDVPLYDFEWKYPGPGGHSSFDPSVSIFMGYVKRGYMNEKDFSQYLTFASEKEALALWEQVLKTVRKRPE